MERLRSTVFERHPRATLAAVTLFLLGCGDLLAGALLLPAPGGPARPGPLSEFVRRLDVRGYRVADGRFHHGFRPDASFMDRFAERDYLVETNSLGFKDSEIREIAPSSDKVRVLFLGDSFVEGIGFTYDRTFVGLVDARLGRERFEVLNASVASYSPRLYEAKLRYLLDEVRLEVDHLYLFPDLTDVHNEIEYESWSPDGTPGAAAPVEPRRGLRRWSFVANLAAELARTVGEWSAIHDLQRLDKEMYAFTSDPEVAARWGRKGLERSEAAVQRILDLCRERGIRVTLVVYPHPRQVIDEERDSAWVALWRGVAERNGARFVDLFRAFIDPALLDPPSRTGEKRFLDVCRRFYLSKDMHWNAEGHAFVADHLPLPAAP